MLWQYLETQLHGSLLLFPPSSLLPPTSNLRALTSPAAHNNATRANRDHRHAIETEINPPLQFATVVRGPTIPFHVAQAFDLLSCVTGHLASYGR
jgi:hypothetical protein